MGSRSNLIVFQVLCVISQIYTLSFLTYYTCAVLIKILSEEAFSGGKAIQIFEVASNAGLTATSAFFIHSSWKRRHLILEVVERARVTCLSNRKLHITCALVSKNFLDCQYLTTVGFLKTMVLQCISALRMFQFNCGWIWNY